MASYNTPIITTQGQSLLKDTIDNNDTMTFTKIVFSSDDYSQSTDSNVASLTALSRLDLTATARAFVDVNGNLKIRGVATNQNTTSAFYIKTYGLYVKNSAGTEMLFAVATTQNANFVPAYNNKQTNQVAYTFNLAISSTSNITLSNQSDVDVTQADIAGINNAVNSNASSLTATQSSFASSMNSAFSANSSNNSNFVSSATTSLTSYVSSNVSSMQSQVGSNATNIANNSSAISANATNIANNSSSISSLSSSAGSAISTNATNIATLQSSVASNSNGISSNANSASSAVGSLQTSINSNSSAISSNAVNIANNSNAISSNASLTSQAVAQINNNISNIQNNMNDLNNRSIKKQDENIGGTGDFLDISKNISDGYHYITNFTGSGLPDGFGNWGFMQKLQFGNDFTITAISTNNGYVWSNTLSGYYNEYRGWKKLGGIEPAQQYRGLWQGRGYGDLNGQPDGIYSIDINVQPRDSFLPSACSGYGTLTLTTNWTGFDRYIVIHDSANNMFRNHAFGNSGNNNGWVQF